MSKITTAAKMSGDWWAERLSDVHADKREAFGAEVARLVELAMRGEITWKHRTEERTGYTVSFMVQVPGDGLELSRLQTQFDYDPDPLLWSALKMVIGPNLKVYELRDVLPRKHDLTINLEKMVLEPKEGYGNWTADIPIPVTMDRQMPDRGDLNRALDIVTGRFQLMGAEVLHIPV